MRGKAAEAETLITQAGAILTRLKTVVEDLDAQYKEMDKRVTTLEKEMSDLYLVVSALEVGKAVKSNEGVISKIQSL